MKPVSSTSPLRRLGIAGETTRSTHEPALPRDRYEAAAPSDSGTSWRAVLALGALALSTGAGIATAQVQAQPQEATAQRFLQVALGRGEQAPRGQALEVLQEYVRTDFGQEMIGRVLADFDQALARGWVTPQGELTEEGEFAGYLPFRVVHSPDTAAASLREVRLPERFATHFKGSGQRVFPLAIVHHEFGHTQFGQPAKPHEIVTDQHGSRLHVEHEMEIVEKFENPVRLRYGYEARESYHNHLGERAERRPTREGTR